ncbi:MAG TPA: outer membrane protein assembly factor BamD [Thermoanaerobaculia bacterium]|nr:outer membrane protein assembly factor BamD [Thermoanaerobaculia bacterium]
MKLTRIVIPVLALLLVAACNRGPRPMRPVVDPEFLNLSKEQIFERGEELFADRKWLRARTHFSHVYENFPNDPLGRRSLLRVADAFYRQGDPVSLVEAQYKYRDFLNRFPGSESADYAMLQIAMVAYKQMERPDRDQQKTREAVEKFGDMIRTYPRSPLRAEAEAKLAEALDRLASHEHIVARFYARRRSWNAAVQRLNFLIDTYPTYSQRDAAFFDLGHALARLGRDGEARLYFERVLLEFPQSSYADRAKRRLDDMKA